MTLEIIKNNPRYRHKDPIITFHRMTHRFMFSKAALALLERVYGSPTTRVLLLRDRDNPDILCFQPVQPENENGWQIKTGRFDGSIYIAAAGAIDALDWVFKNSITKFKVHVSEDKTMLVINRKSVYQVYDGRRYVPVGNTEPVGLVK